MLERRRGRHDGGRRAGVGALVGQLLHGPGLGDGEQPRHGPHSCLRRRPRGAGRAADQARRRHRAPRQEGLHAADTRRHRRPPERRRDPAQPRGRDRGAVGTDQGHAAESGLLRRPIRGNGRLLTFV